MCIEGYNIILIIILNIYIFGVDACCRRKNSLQQPVINHCAI